MKIKCLKCQLVKELTGKEKEEKAAMFDNYMNSAVDYLNLLSLTGGECSIVGPKLGNKHFFEIEEETDKSIHEVLSSAAPIKTEIDEGLENVGKLKANIELLAKELRDNESRLKEVETSIPFAMDELNKQKVKFKEITGIGNMEKWK